MKGANVRNDGKSMKSRFLMMAAAVAATGTVATWALATDVVVLHPATLRAQFTYTSEPVSSITLSAHPVAGGHSSSRSVAATSSPFSVDLTVEGGDGDLGASNPGVGYTTAMHVFMSSQSNTYLSTWRSGTVTVQNTSPTTPDVEVVAMPLTATLRVVGDVQVVYGKLKNLSIYTAVQNAGHYHQGGGSASFPTKPASGSAWAPFPAGASVSVWGTAYVEDDAGNVSQRSLGTKTLVVAGPVTTTTWTIDLGDTTTVRGVLGSQMPGAPGGRTCYYSGEGAASGVYGSKSINDGEVECVVSLSPPATYKMYVTSRLGAPTHQNVTTPSHVFTVSGGEHIERFDESWGSAVIVLDAVGMFDPGEITLGSSMYLTADLTAESSTSAADGYLTHLLPVGAWRHQRITASLYNASNPSLPLNELIEIYDETFPLGTVTEGQITDLGTVPLTLSRSNVFFDVKEPDGSPEMNLRSPQVSIGKTDYGSKRTDIAAHGSSLSAPVSALTVVAPPGEYWLSASAEVNGSRVTFADSIIKFGTILETSPAQAGLPIVLTPDDPELRVDLTFPSINQQGYTTVVQTPLGPEPPEKFKLSCDITEIGCRQLYYDITTTAEYDGGTSADPLITVCVQRTFHEADNALASELALFHFDSTLTVCEPGMDPDLSTPGCWVDITKRQQAAPHDRIVVDCTDAAPGVCSCGADPLCGADPENRKQVFKICGMTNSFSPFAVMEVSRFRYTNEIDGVQYSGPDGPAALQQFQVPRSGNYRITATGARGGSSTRAPAVNGGCGAEISGTFALQAGQVIEMLVGQAGTSTTDSGGGGGGTFVVRNGEKLAIAGGGGGVRNGATVSGRHASTGANGVPGSTSSSYATPNVAGGLNGAGGARASGLGSGGGGWSGNGAADGSNGEGGFSFASALNGGRGGKALRCTVSAHGGYGGGGSGNGCYGGGGGGGYSGGGGGRVAGGGGSFNAGTSPSGTSGVCTDSGHGMVIIERIN
jgi:hypothetical protein